MEQLELVTTLLRSQSTLALSTVSSDGLPCVAPVFYLVADYLRLYWFSSASSEHAGNLRRIPAAAVSIYRPTEDWRQICGVQMRGSVALITDPLLREAITRTYVERFALGDLFGAAISRSDLCEFRPSWVRYLDNAQGFGYKFEISLNEL